MEVFDLIVIGTGSAMNIVDALIQEKANLRIAVIDKDEPGGICLTKDAYHQRSCCTRLN
jgi:dihydrolipoamide dehydrogenase